MKNSDIWNSKESAAEYIGCLLILDSAGVRVLVRKYSNSTISDGLRSGIGRAVAERYANESADVLIVGRAERSLKETAGISDFLVQSDCFTVCGDYSLSAGMPAWSASLRSMLRVVCA